MKTNNPQQSDQDRTDYIISQFLPPNFRTMQDISDELGISKQRVHQILKSNNIKANDGGKKLKIKLSKAQKKINNKQKRQRSILRQYGCTEKEALMINGGKPLNTVGTPAYKYKCYCHNLNKKDIDCNLSFPEWYSVWQKSGKYGQMKPGRGGYSLVRKDTSAPASVGNVEVMESHKVRRHG